MGETGLWLEWVSGKTSEISSGENISVKVYSLDHLSLFYLLRKCLGPELVIVILTMQRKNIIKRIKQRHGEDKDTIDWLMVILLLFSC